MILPVSKKILLNHRKRQNQNPVGPCFGCIPKQGEFFPLTEEIMTRGFPQLKPDDCGDPLQIN